MPRTANRCKETTTTTGTGAVTLLGAVSQHQSFQSALGSSSVTCQYAIVGQTGTEWETGYGTFDGTSTLTRDVILSSSNSNAVVSLSAGTKDVFCTVNASFVYNAGLGQILAQVNGWCMP